MTKRGWWLAVDDKESELLALIEDIVFAWAIAEKTRPSALEESIFPGRYGETYPYFAEVGDDD